MQCFQCFLCSLCMCFPSAWHFGTRKPLWYVAIISNSSYKSRLVSSCLVCGRVIHIRCAYCALYCTIESLCCITHLDPPVPSHNDTCASVLQVLRGARAPNDLHSCRPASACRTRVAQHALHGAHRYGPASGAGSPAMRLRLRPLLLFHQHPQYCTSVQYSTCTLLSFIKF